MGDILWRTVLDLLEEWQNRVSTDDEREREKDGSRLSGVSSSIPMCVYTANELSRFDKKGEILLVV